MTNLLYIGNKLSNKDKTVTSIETLGSFLEVEGFMVRTASSKANKFLRLLDMLYHVVNYRKYTDFVLIDTYSTTNFYYAFFVSKLCRFLRLKYIPILRGGNLPNRLKLNPKLSKAIFRNAHKNIAPSFYTKLNFEEFGYTNINCIPNSIELKNYPFKNRHFEKVKLLWVRSFSEIYNPLLAVRVLKTLNDENIEAELCMVGPENDGSQKEVKEYASELNIEVKFVGKLKKEEWINLSKDYNIFINTTNFDNMPVSVIEAMALGLPVISTNVGGIPFLIDHNQDGILVEPNNVTVFVDSIKQIISQPEFAKSLALEARKKVEQFDWGIVKHKWTELLQ